MNAEVAYFDTSRGDQHMVEVHKIGCKDAQGGRGRRAVSNETVTDFPDDGLWESHARFMGDLCFYTGAYDQGEWPDFKVMPCLTGRHTIRERGQWSAY